MLVKICGISNALDAMTAVECGASAIGFVMGGKVLPVEVEAIAQHVREIIRRFPGGVDSYVVTHLLNAADIIALADYVGSTGIQVSEDVGVPFLSEVRKGTKKKIIKTVTVKDQSSFDKLQGYAPLCDHILLDSQVAGYTGGTGVTSDWNLARELIKASKTPVYLAGGLSPANVEEAIRTTEPAGVDVSTGVSTYCPEYLRKDRKDPAKIEKFISLARSQVKNAIA